MCVFEEVCESVFLCVRVCSFVFVCISLQVWFLNVVWDQRSGQSPALSPPDVGGLRVFLLSHESSLWALAAGSLTTIAWVSIESRFSRFVLFALPRRARELQLRVGGQGLAVVFDGRAGWRRGEGGAEAQAVTQSPPVLLAL